MRNAVLAVALVLAGISANFAPAPSPGGNEASAGSAKAHSGTSRNSRLPNDHPVTMIFEYFNQQQASHPETRSAEVKGRIDVSVREHAPELLDLHWEAAEPQDAVSPDAIEKLRNGKLDFLIATVPDPQRTHLAVNFDRYVMSIISAAADSGYSFDRYWLPWRTEPEPEIQDPDKRKKAHAEKERREQLPGLLLFRRTPKDEDEVAAVAVLLVGELPTSGIDRSQFRNATRIIAGLTPDALCEPLNLLAPVFSGSLESLRRALREDLQCGVAPHIVSGTASSRDDLLLFKKKYSQFGTTIHTDTYALNGLLSMDFLKGQTWAVVAEDTTDYGNQFKSYKLPAGSKPPIIIYYPREISCLRNAYQNDPELSAQQRAKEVPGTRQQLTLGLKDTQTVLDTLPQFSTEHTPVTQETALLHVAQTLKREKVQIAVLNGTHILDILFLGRFLREACPDLRLVVLDSDLLLVHATDSLNYLGMLAVSTYPLFPENQLWTESPENGHLVRTRRFFAANDSEGFYNACLLLLGHLGDCPRDHTPLREYAIPGAAYVSRPPPLWLTTIGRGRYYPLAVLRGDGDAEERALLKSDAAQPGQFEMLAPTRVWLTLFGASSLLVAAFLLVSVHARRLSSPLERWCSDFHPRPEKTAPSSRSYYLLCTIVFILLAYGVLTLAPLRIASASGSWPWKQIAEAATALIFLLALLAVWTAWPLPRLPKFLTLMCALVLCVWWWLVACSGGAERDLFRALRSVDVPSGVSPNLPFLFLLGVLGWWSWCQLQRFIYGQERSIFLPSIKYVPSTITRRIKKRLKQPFLYGDSFGLCVCGGAFLLTLTAGGIAIRSLESRWYDFAFSFLLAAVFGLLVGTAYCYRLIWADLRRLLEILELHPLRDVFSRLPPIANWSPLWQPNPRRRSYVIPSRSLDCLRRLSASAPAYYELLPGDLTAIEQRANAIRLHFEKGEREPAEAFFKAQICATRIAASLAEKLEQSGIWQEGSSATLDRIEAAHGKGSIRRGSIRTWGGSSALELRTTPKEVDETKWPDLLAAEFVALRYIAYIRYVLLHLRNQLSFLTVGLILSAIALNCYPFQGGSLFRWWISGTFVLLSIVVVSVFVEMERDATLSRLSDTTAGKLDKGFYVKLVTAGALPLLTVVASQFPSVGRFLFSWIQPALSSLR